MHVLIWIVVSLVVSTLASRTRVPRGPGLTTDIAVGLLGAVVTGGTLHGLGLTSPGQPGTQAAVAAAGTLAMIALARAVMRWAQGALPSHVAETGKTGAKEMRHDFESQLRALGAVERRILAKLVRRETVARNPNLPFDEQLTIGQRIADRVAAFGGSWTFILLFLSAMGLWMMFNTRNTDAFDPYPFILLNLVLSCLAALQAPIIMMSQNRQSAKDRLDAGHDYEVNLKAEMEIMGLHAKLDDLRERHWQDLLHLQEQQLELLRIIEGRSAPTPPSN